MVTHTDDLKVVEQVSGLRAVFMTDADLREIMTEIGYDAAVIEAFIKLCRRRYFWALSEAVGEA